ncbi:hypothetical protein L1887_63366 [Cichorium endivia]|nr:hypothetical protein L1887_63366 [Cichorium endivia]
MVAKTEEAACGHGDLRAAWLGRVSVSRWLGRLVGAIAVGNGLRVCVGALQSWESWDAEEAVPLCCAAALEVGASASGAGWRRRERDESAEAERGALDADADWTRSRVARIVATGLVAVMVEKGVFALLVLEPLHVSEVGFEHANCNGDHAGLDDACPDALAAADANVDDALESEASTFQTACISLMEKARA